MRMFNSDENVESLFRMIGDFIEERERSALRIVNPEKYQIMLAFIDRFLKYLNESKQEFKISCNFGIAFNTGSISVETDYACFMKRKGGLDLFSISDELEVYALDDGKVRFDFTFYDVLKNINAAKETEQL